MIIHENNSLIDTSFISAKTIKNLIFDVVFGTFSIIYNIISFFKLSVIFTCQYNDLISRKIKEFIFL